MLKNLPIVLLAVALIGLVWGASLIDPRNQLRQNTPRDKALCSVVAQTESVRCAADAQGSDQARGWRLIISWPEGVATLGVLLTLFFIAWQAILMRQAISDAERASKRELRAYLTVVIGGAFFQERREREKGGDLMFECRPLLINTGKTPARKITFKARAAVLPSPLPNGMHLPDAPDSDIGGSMLGAQQNAHMSTVVDGFRSDDEVPSIKYGGGDKALYCWGRISYEDVFGESHFTQFCQHIYWDLKDNVMGHYVPGRNDAD